MASVLGPGIVNFPSPLAAGVTAYGQAQTRSRQEELLEMQKEQSKLQKGQFILKWFETPANVRNKSAPFLMRMIGGDPSSPEGKDLTGILQSLNDEQAAAVGSLAKKYPDIVPMLGQLNSTQLGNLILESVKQSGKNARLDKILAGSPLDPNAVQPQVQPEAPSLPGAETPPGAGVPQGQPQAIPQGVPQAVPQAAPQAPQIPGLNLPPPQSLTPGQIPAQAVDSMRRAAAAAGEENSALANIFMAHAKQLIDLDPNVARQKKLAEFYADLEFKLRNQGALNQITAGEAAAKEGERFVPGEVGQTVVGPDNKPIVKPGMKMKDLPNLGGRFMGKEEEAQALSRGREAGQMQQKTSESSGNILREMDTLRNSFNSEYLTYQGKVKAWTLQQREKLGANLNDTDKKFLQGFSDFQVKTIRGLNAYIKEITGAQMSEPEAKRIKAGQPNLEMSPTQFIAAMDATLEQARLVQARTSYTRAKGLPWQSITLNQMPGIIRKRGAEIERTLRQSIPDIGPADLKRQVTDALKSEFGF